MSAGVATLANMSEETKVAAATAQQNAANAQNKVDTLAHRLLVHIAENVPARVEAIAKQAAQAEPDVTRGLGREGLAAMRAHLDEASTQIGELFLRAEPAMRWPTAEDEWDTVTARDVHRMLFDRFRHQLGGPVKVLSGYGYVKARTRAIAPQELYDQDGDDFTSLAAALTDLGRARVAVRKAIDEDNRSDVNDLWGD